MENKVSFEIPLDEIEENLKLQIISKKENTLFFDKDAFTNNESPYQLIEGSFYEYQFSSKEYSFKKDLIIDPSSFSKHQGRISPNIYVGNLLIPIYSNENIVGKIELEIQSIKSTYREDYRYMLECITEKCTDLILQANSPVSHTFITDFESDSQTLYQRFAFVKSIITSQEFKEAIQRIILNPTTKWIEQVELTDARKIKRFRNEEIKQLLNSNNKFKLSKGHPLNSKGIDAIATKIYSNKKQESIDTSENRFIKHALETFLKFCMDIKNKANAESRLINEASNVIFELENHLQHSIFKEIGRPTSLKLNSPILQRKEGYREVLKVWLMFDLAAKLIWKGGEDIYKGGKKDIATLYEYWLFFTLLDLLNNLFKLEQKDIDELIEETDNGLGLRLKQGEFTALSGVYESEKRKLKIKFNYNRTFKGKKVFPNSGSWTANMRPDYTLSIWPDGISEETAESQELIVHIHFDAKYKIANLTQIINQSEFADNDSELNNEKQENLKGIYKNGDLLKMHAYKDAIRRTGGAYILYPGDTPYDSRGFREVIPGLGAFPIKPSRTDNGIVHLENFIKEIIHHFLNRASQREHFAYKTYDIHKNEKPNELRELIPNSYNEEGGLVPDETFVLIGFYNTPEQLEWIKKKKLYNFRMGSGNGSLVLDKATVNSKYLLLHTNGDVYSQELYKIVGKGPKVYSKNNLLKKGYPSPTQDFYLILELEKVDMKEFGYAKWKFKELKNYKTGNASAFPYTATLTELMQVKIKE
jgi:hypothetical protein